MDQLIVNGNIVSPGEMLHNADAILIRNECIVAVGEQSELQDAAERDVNIIDAQGATVLPGFIDAHNHFTLMGMQFFQLDLEGKRTRAEILRAIHAEHLNLTESRVLFAFNYEIDHIPPSERITNVDLESAAPGRYIQVTDRSGHMSVTNERTLTRAGIQIDHGSDCPHKTDHFNGEVCGKVNTRLSCFFQREIHTEMNLRMAWKRAAEDAVAHGVTCIQMISTEEDFPLIMNYRSCLPIYLQIYAETRNVEMVADSGLKQIGGCGRVMVDGDTGPYTAAFFAPYLDNPDSTGRLYYSDDELFDYILRADKAGLQVALHCVGDAASAQMVQTVAKARAITGSRLRHRIEHFEFADDRLKDDVKQNGLCLSIQPSFNYYWPHKHYLESLGEERANAADPIRSIADRGIPIGFGSDCTVTPCDPLLTIHSAVNHSNPAERISVQRAIRCHTLGSAYLGMLENERGSIVPGKIADLVFLKANPADVSPQTIKDIPITMTIAKGNIVYAR